MNVNYNTSLQGKYTFYDESMKILCETDNLITDWGMDRFVGDRTDGGIQPADTDASQTAFVNNTQILVIGSGTTPASATDWQLQSIVPLSFFVITNDGATTGTTLSTDSNQDLLIIFTRMQKFVASSLPAPVVINEVGCNWSSTFVQNNRYGIFSRATLAQPFTIIPNNTIFVKYVLTIKTNANKVLSSMYHLSGTGATAFPNNKTNVRDLPLFTLKTDGTPAATLNNNNVGAYGTFYCYNHPLFEDAGSHNQTYSGLGLSNDATFTLTTKRSWWLQFYTSSWVVATGAPINGGSDPLSRYNSFVSTTMTNLNNATRFEHNPCCPCYSLGVAYPSVAGINYGGSAYDVVVTQNLNLFTDARDAGRKVPDSEVLVRPNNDTWIRRLRFLFTPNQLKTNITVLKLYRTPLGDWNNNADNWWCGNKQRQTILYLDSVGFHSYGIVTVFDAGYTANLNLYTGFEYSFTFTRN